MTLKVNSTLWFALIISILLLTDLSIILNTPFLRQIIGFLFLTVLPGLLILQILKLNKIGYTEKFVLSVGLSVSFLMLFGLLINNISLSLGYLTPLSTISLLISFNLAIIVLILVAHRMDKGALFSLPNLNLNTSEKAFLIVPILFPALSIFGMHVMNTTDNNIILMFLLFLIPTYVAFVCFFNHKFPKRLYPVVIFLISISLILMLALRSNHIIGSDSHAEYYFFQTTLNNLHWSIVGHSILDACLSISLQPTIYQSILNISPEFLFKILYSLIFSTSPLVIYVLSKRYIGEPYAFLASCFFMCQYNFLWTEFNARTNSAILFFALAMMVLFDGKIEPLKKRILFIVFMASCMVAHYSTTYVFFFIMLGSFLSMEALSRKYTFEKVISLTLVFMFFAFIFFWYSQVTETAFNAGVGFIETSIISLNDFFIMESRHEGAQLVVGKGIGQKSIPGKIQFVFTWLTFVFIGIGIITLIKKYKAMSFPELKYKKPDFLKEKFEVAYFVIALACSGLLVATLAVPRIAGGYSLGRVYLVALVILSVLFVIGGIVLSKNLSLIKKSFTKRGHYLKNNGKNTMQQTSEKFDQDASQVLSYLIILLVLIPYFLCNTGAMYTILGVPHSIILHSEGEPYDKFYVHDQQIIAGEWQSSSKVIEGILVNKQKTICNMPEYLKMFDEKNRIYDNGGSEVWR